MPPRTLRQWAGLQPIAALPPDRCALLLIDFQREYFDPARLYAPDGPSAAANAARLLDAAAAVGMKVVHVQHVAANPASPVFAAGSPGIEFVDPVRPRAGQDVVVKTIPSSFHRTDLDARLRMAKVDTLLLTGIATHMCIDHTARDALALGHRVVVVGDACASRDLPDPDGRLLRADELHRAALTALADRFADVLTTERTLALLQR